MTGAVGNVDQRPYATRLQERKEGDNANRNKYIQLLSSCLMDHSCPMTLRKLIEAQHSHEGVKSNQPDNQNIYIKTLTAATVGTVFTVATRVVRTAVRTICLPATLLYSVGKAERYNLQGEVWEDLSRTGHEWVDLGVGLLCFPLSIAKTFKPDSCNSTVDSLRDRYVARIDSRNARDKYVEEQISKYRANRAQINEAWRKGEKPPVFAPAQ
jgi:hypothetical protein